jgi:hypothetical protein
MPFWLILCSWRRGAGEALSNVYAIMQTSECSRCDIDPMRSVRLQRRASGVAKRQSKDPDVRHRATRLFIFQ